MLRGGVQIAHTRKFKLASEYRPEWPQLRPLLGQCGWDGSAFAKMRLCVGARRLQPHKPHRRTNPHRFKMVVSMPARWVLWAVFVD